MLPPYERTHVLQGWNHLAPGGDGDLDDLEDDDLGSDLYEFSTTELATND
jgi:hypothetical protein